MPAFQLTLGEGGLFDFGHGNELTCVREDSRVPQGDDVSNEKARRERRALSSV